MRTSTFNDMPEHLINVSLTNNFKSSDDNSEVKMRCLELKVIYNFPKYI
jgi:hypothetical protein